MKTALVCGAGGFIGSHLVKSLKKEGFWVRAVDLKSPQFSSSAADEFIIGDLRQADFCKDVVDQDFHELYQLAADMGGAEFIFTGDNDADILYNSALINLNILNCCRKKNIKRIFYSSSACIYPKYNQENPDNPICTESSAYPASPDSEYGWEKLFSERLYYAYAKNYGLNIRVARYHNIFGEEGSWRGGREKAPAALCRKIAEASAQSSIEIFGDGHQTRSFLYINECIEGTLKLTRSNFTGPVNIGSKEKITINDLAQMIIKISGKTLSLHHIDGPLGVRGRTSDNKLIFETLNWEPTRPLLEGLEKTYHWVSSQVNVSVNGVGEITENPQI